MYAVPSLLACLFLQPVFIERFVRRPLKNQILVRALQISTAPSNTFYIKVIMVIIICFICGEGQDIQEFGSAA